jgi:DNA-binding response OmpR family regulator
LIKVLIVDDEPEIISFVQPFLELEGYSTITAKDGAQALEHFDSSIDIVLLDVMLPYFDGYEVCKTIRSRSNTPIIFITAKGDLDDRLKSFATGGDDYVQKPFYLEELNARIQNILKRQTNNQSVIKCFGNLTIDYSRHEVRIDAQIIPITKTEFEIITLLSLNSNKVFSKDDIYYHLNETGEGYSDVIVEHIRKIRSKFSEYGVNNAIETIWGVGYKWKK